MSPWQSPTKRPISLRLSVRHHADLRRHADTCADVRRPAQACRDLRRFSLVCADPRRHARQLCAASRRVRRAPCLCKKTCLLCEVLIPRATCTFCAIAYYREPILPRAAAVLACSLAFKATGAAEPSHRTTPWRSAGKTRSNTITPPSRFTGMASQSRST